MITNFTEYWEDKKEILEKLNVSRDVAKMIWCDSADCFAVTLILKNQKP